MAASLELGRVGAIVLRQMRRPIMTLLLVYAVAVLGMTLIPGKAVDGQPNYMSLFHAFYFITYTATTTGFGEIPYEFSEAQRVWAIVCLYVSVIAWFYAVGAIIRLIQNPYFRQALAERNFAKSVDRITGPFFILCGFGDTGSLLARGLSDARISAVILEPDEARIQALTLRDYSVPMPGLCADAGIPVHLQEAGIERDNCRAVIAATNNEQVNLKISAIASLLNERAMIVTRSRVDVYEEMLSTLSDDLHIVDPFKVFAKGLSGAIFNPPIYMLNEWLVGAPGVTSTTLQRWIDGDPGQRLSIPPRGKWIICGYGRMGHEVHSVLARGKLEVAVIDPQPDDSDDRSLTHVLGDTTASTLRKAGIEDAVGIIAGTDDDGYNLGILLNARALNPNLFIIVRQNRHQNEVAFSKAQADIIMQPSLVTARRILMVLIAPLLKPFFKYLLTRPTGEKRELMKELLQRLIDTLGSGRPHLLTLNIDREASAAVVDLIDRGETVLLGDVLRNPLDRSSRIATVPLVACRGADRRGCGDDGLVMLPVGDYELGRGDQLLLCGREAAHRLLDATLNNEYTLHYLRTGREKPRGYFMEWLVKRYPGLAR